MCDTRSCLLAAATLILAALLVPVRAGSADLPFGSRVDLPSGLVDPHDLEVGDLDGDGLADLVACGVNGHRLRIWYGQGAGAFVEGESIINFHSAYRLALGDLDRDGDLDIVVGQYFESTQAELMWFRNPARGGGDWVTHVIYHTSGVRDLALADVDADGDLDLAAAILITSSTSAFVWYENTGAPPDEEWGPHGVYAATGDAEAVTAFDIDLDGDVDLAGATSDAGSVLWCENIGGGGAWASHGVGVANGGARELSVGDLDRDGRPDIVVVAADGVSWYRWNDSGLWWRGNLWYSFGAEVSAVRLVDLDHDGDLDLLASWQTASMIRWHENLGGDTWRTHEVADGFSARDLAAGDLDGDGDPDVAAVSAAGLVSWWEDESIHRRFVTAEPVDGCTGLGDPRDVEVGDLNNDGLPDLVAAQWDGDAVSVCYSLNAAGTTWWPDTLSTSFDGARDVAVADVNGDGHLDVLAAAVAGDKVNWWENDGSAFPAWTAHTVLTGFDGAHRVVPADFDRDGDVDLVVAGYYADQVRVLTNENGVGTSWSSDPFTAVDGPFELAVGDLDGDGAPDVVAEYYDAGVVMSYLNLGGIWGWTTVASGLSGPRGLDLGDVDGDGDLDVVVAVRTSDQIRWYTNNGSGTAWTAHDVGTGSYDDGVSVRAADVDHDGDTDVVAVGTAGDDVSVWLNGGDGTAWVRDQVEQSLDSPWSVTLGDVNRDGHLDLVVAAGGGADALRWYPNVGEQLTDLTWDEAPSHIPGGERDVVFSFILTHNGRDAWDANLELASLHLGFSDAAGTPLTEAQANAVVDRLEVYQDTDHDALFTPGSDMVVAVDGYLTLVDGWLDLEVPDGSAFANVAPGDSWRFFLVLTADPEAGQHSPSSIRVTLPDDGVGAEDRSHDLPLLGEPNPALTTGPIALGDDSSLIFADGFDTGTAAAWSGVSP